MTEMKMCLIDKNRLLSERRKSTYYHLPNGDTAIPIIDIEHAPIVDAIPVVHGTWKAVTEDGEEYKRICSCCGGEAPYDEIEEVYLLYLHCPWCGARMGVGQE